MADPLSISASVVALVTIAGQLGSGLDRFLANVKDAPALIREIQAELISFKAVLSGLEKLLVTSNLLTSRGALIKLEDVVAAFTSALLFFSELEKALSPLIGPGKDQFELLSRVQWATKKARFSELLDRQQRHKLTLTLLLIALNSPSERQAEEERQKFHSTVQDRLDGDKDLERRVKRVESALQRLKVAPPSSTAELHPDDDDAESETRTIRHIAGDTVILEHNSREFELVLSESWVYRRNQRRDEDLSFRSSVCRQSAWTTLSDLTLADVSILSVIALPIDWQELPSLPEAITSNGLLNSPYESSNQKDTDEQIENKFQQWIDKLDNSPMRELVRGDETMRNELMFLMMKAITNRTVRRKRKEALQDLSKALQNKKKALKKLTEVLQIRKEALRRKRGDSQKESGIEREAFMKEMEALLKSTDTMLKETDTALKETQTLLKNRDALLEKMNALLKNTDPMLKETYALLKDWDTSQENMDALLKKTTASLEEMDTIFKETNTVLKETDTILKGK